MEVDGIADSVRELILTYTRAEVDRAILAYVRIIHGDTGIDVDHLMALARRIPGARVRTMCLGVNRKNGKRCSNEACGDTGYCERHLSQHPNFAALAMNPTTTVPKRPKIHHEDENTFKELDTYHLRSIQD